MPGDELSLSWVAAGQVRDRDAVVRKGRAANARPAAHRAADRTRHPRHRMTVAMCAQVGLVGLRSHLRYRGSGDAFFLIRGLVRKLPGRRTSAGIENQPAATALSRAPNGGCWHEAIRK